MGAAARPHDHAGSDAHEVVGLYGDPDSTWGIAAELALDAPLAVGDLRHRAAALTVAHPWLGERAEVVAGDDDADWARVRTDLAARAYPPGAPLVRLAVDRDRRRLLIAAHHGAVDGLGLLGIAAAVLDRDVRTHARGLGSAPARHGFLASSARRFGEALLAPPARVPGAGEPGEVTEDLTRVDRPREAAPRVGTSTLAAAVVGALASDGRTGRRTVVLAVGASRRQGDRPDPDRQTAYLRLRVPPGAPAAEVARRLREQPPEPDFPATSARGLGPWVTGRLRQRLGSTATLSNLGRIEAPGVLSVAMFPALNGPRAVGVGLASTSTSTVLSLRTRRRDLTRAEHDALLASIASRLFDAAQYGSYGES